MSESIPLKTYRLSPRKARIDISDDTVSVFLPTYFGKRRIATPLAGMAVSDLGTLPDWGESNDVFVDRISIPYFFTTGPLTKPTTLLLFREPQRVPRLRWITAIAPNVDLPFGYFETKSERGAWIDGMLLRAADPADAFQRLVQAGAEPVMDPNDWLRLHRKTASGPEREETLRKETSLKWKVRVSSALWIGALLGLTFANSVESAPSWAWWLPAAAIVAAVALRWLIRRDIRRSTKGTKS